MKKVQTLEDGSLVLIEQSGISLDVQGATETLPIEMTQGEWAKIINADRSKHDVVLDKETKSLTLKAKPKQDKK